MLPNNTGRASEATSHMPCRTEDQITIRDLETITNLTDRIEKIARNLRHLTKPAKPDFRPLNLDNLLRSTVDLLASTTGKLRGFETENPEARFRIAFDIEEDLPYVKGDQHALESAIINMILNSATAIQEKGSGTLTISAHRTDSGVTLKVEDEQRIVYVECYLGEKSLSIASIMSGGLV